MTQSAREPIYQAISSIRLIDPHTHINPHQPASSTLADILGYHYYTELVHSAGVPRAEIEQEGLHPRELVERLVQGLPNIENTANYQWLIEICREFFDFDDVCINHSNWESLYDTAEARMNSAEWPQMVLDQSNVEAVFLTNDFDDDLEGFDTNTYIPCLRTDDLVFHLSKQEVRERLEVCTGIQLDGSLTGLRESLEQRFQHFTASGARACAISIPPTFEPTRVSDGRAQSALDAVLQSGTQADASHIAALSRRVFWTLAELCDQYRLPFDLMIGVNRGVYPGGVYQGQDLYDSRVSLIQYRELFNSFPDVKFPISVLASVTNQELVSYAWIFPNVITNGHWWYSNTPSFIARDAAARLEAVPRNKQIGYYSDAYKLEFVYPKFDMYRQVLAGILADHFVGFCGWSEERAIELGRQVLRDNVDLTFAPPIAIDSEDTHVIDTVRIASEDDADVDQSADPVSAGDASAAASAALAAGAIGMVEVNDTAEPAEFDPTTVAGVQEIVQTEFAAPAEPFDEESTDIDPDFVVQQNEGKEYDTVDEESLPELPTIVDLNDTVKLEAEDESSAIDRLAETIEFDMPPTDEEIQAVDDVPDVVLHEDIGERIPDADEIEAAADFEPLNVGDLTGDDDDSSGDVNVLDDVDVLEEPLDPGEAEIRLLRGEDSFTPDEDSLQLTRHPVTGELIYPVDGGNTETAQTETVTEDTFEFDDIVDDDGPETTLEETVDIDDDDVGP